MVIILLIILFGLLPYSYSFDCLTDMERVKKFDSTKLEFYKKCILNSVDHWYEDHNFDDNLFDIFQKLSEIDTNKNTLDTLLTLKIDDRIKAAYILFYKPDSVKFYETIKDTNFVKIIRMLNSNNSYTEDQTLSILNSNDLNRLLFFLSYVAFKKEKKYLNIILSINTYRFPDGGAHSDRDILRTYIDLTYGALMQED
jgi:hypothetical protein